MAAKTIFQPGLQVRCSGQAEHVYHFILAAVLGNTVGGRAQWHKQTNWRQSGGNPQDKDWRLKRATSSGMFGGE